MIGCVRERAGRARSITVVKWGLDEDVAERASAVCGPWLRPTITAGFRLELSSFERIAP